MLFTGNCGISFNNTPAITIIKIPASPNTNRQLIKSAIIPLTVLDNKIPVNAPDDMIPTTRPHYTDKGLTPSLIRDENNKRLFNDASLQWLAGAKKLKTCGMSIDNIKKYVDLCLEGESTINQRYELIAAQKEEVLRKYEEMKQMRDYIIAKEQHYRDIIDGKIEDDTNPSLWSSTGKAYDYANA